MGWTEIYRRKVTSAEEAVKLVRSGDHVWLHAGCNNPEELLKALVGRAGELHDVEVTHLLTFGAADHVDPKYSGSFRHRALFTGPNVRQAVNEGRADWVPVFLSEIPGLIRSRVDPGGRGLHPDLAARRARLLLLRGRRRVHEGRGRERPGGGRPRQPADAAVARRLLHPRVPPHPRGRDRPARDRAAAWSTEVERRLAGHREERRRPDRERLHPPDGDRRDPGRGAALPRREARPRHPHRDVLGRGGGALRARASSPARPRPSTRGRSSPRSCWARRRRSTSSTTTPSWSSTRRDYVNDPFVIAQNDKMVAINSAIAVDITGQVCSDSMGRSIYSGFGGQVDFIRGARRSRGGKPIIALPSTAKDGQDLAHRGRAGGGLGGRHEPGRRAVRGHGVRGREPLRQVAAGAGPRPHRLRPPGLPRGAPLRARAARRLL